MSTVSTTEGGQRLALVDVDHDVPVDLSPFGLRLALFGIRHRHFTEQALDQSFASADRQLVDDAGNEVGWHRHELAADGVRR